MQYIGNKMLNKIYNVITLLVKEYNLKFKNNSNKIKNLNTNLP